MKKQWKSLGVACAAVLVVAAAAWANNREQAGSTAAQTAQWEEQAAHGHGMGMGGHGRHGRHMGRRGGMGHGLGGGLLGPRLAKELNLSESQREKLAAIHERTARDGIQAHADVELAELDLSKLMRDETPDLRAINAQIDRIASLRAGIQKTHVAARFEMRSVLTAQQREKLQELRMKAGPRRGGGPGGPGGPREDQEEEIEAEDDGAES